MPARTATAVLAPSVHGEATCAAVEDLLTEAEMEIDVLRARLEEMTAAHARQIALVEDLRAKMTTSRDEAEALQGQVAMLYAELTAAEAAALPEGTALFGVISEAEVVAAYRAASKITRGPVPPAVRAALLTESERIGEMMAEAARAEVTKIVRREVRRRRAARTGRKPATAR